MIKATDLRTFATAQHIENKHVWRLENQDVKFVLLKDISLFEKVLAWFGYGPLSFANIAEFIGAHAQEIIDNQDLSVVEKADILEKFQHCCLSFNKNHSIRKVSAVAFENLFGPSVQGYTFHDRDATYLTLGLGIDDFSYANGQLGFGYVADGTGHNNQTMATVLKKIFIGFNERYTSAHTNATFKSLEDYRKFVEDQLTALGDEIHNEPEKVLDDPNRPGMTHMNDGTLKPAFSFAQIVRCGDKRVLISAQYSDTMLLIKKADGSFDTTLAAKIVDYGLGERHRKMEKVIRMTEVGPGDVIYGFSDGIGEFLTMSECEEIISANRNPAMTFTELKNKIIEKGKTFVQEENGRRRELQVPSANGQKFTKFHLPDDPKFHDDISMFSLFVK